MALTYGTEGIKQKDYRVYIANSDIDDEKSSGVAAAVATYDGAKNKNNIQALITALDELGECRTDSIAVTAENGDTVEGNVLGEIVLNKACSMAAELINSTPSNIEALADLDSMPVTVVIIEKDTHNVSDNATKTAIVINNIVMSYSENITGGDSIRAMVNLSRNVPSVGDFRSIADIDWSE
jgi:hypothetical protein